MLGEMWDLFDLTRDYKYMEANAAEKGTKKTR